VRSVAIGAVAGRSVVVSGGEDRTIRVWDLAQGRELYRLFMWSQVTAIAFEGADAFLVGCASGIVEIRLNPAALTTGGPA
jgi:WD40 repeat protein